MNRRRFVVSSVAAAVGLTLASRGALAALAPIVDDVAAVTGAGGKVTLGKSAVQELRDSLRGALLLPGQPGYDEARRVLNASIDRHPALVVQPTGAADVRTAVSFARQHDLLLAVKCGGHSYAGKSTCEGGMQLDLSRMRGVHVDQQARTAHVSGGSLLGELDHEAMALGLVTTAGTVSHTGVGGLTLGAGFGRLARRYGLALDNVVGADIVTADGKLLHLSAQENPELFWGIRGGGGNFGVVTAFDFRLHEMPRQVIGGELVFPIARARELLDFYANYSLAAPDELYCDAAMSTPPTTTGRPGVFVIEVCYSGPPGDAERVLAPLRKLGTPLKDGIGPVDYVKLQRSGDRTGPAQRRLLPEVRFRDDSRRRWSRLIDAIGPIPAGPRQLLPALPVAPIGNSRPTRPLPARRSQLDMFVVANSDLPGDEPARGVQRILVEAERPAQRLANEVATNRRKSRSTRLPRRHRPARRLKIATTPPTCSASTRT